MRTHSYVVTLALFAAALPAQSKRCLTAADYARAERFLTTSTTPLVTGLGIRPSWLPDGRVWYRTSTRAGYEFIVVDPARRTRRALFDQPRLSVGLAAAMNTRLDPYQLPFQNFQLSKDSRELTVVAGTLGFRCTIQDYRCQPVDTSASAGAAPPHSVTSPDGRRAAFIRDYNLWVRDLTTGRETQVTTDGVKDFGYATNNAGWVKSDEPVLRWSPDSRRIATFQHDARGTSEMYLVSTNVGAPKLEAWKYPLPGDSVIFRIHRVIVDVDGGKVIRFQMPPDQHRSTICDHIVCNADYTDTEWYPDNSALAFVSVTRDHKQASLRIADAATGAIRNVLAERVPTQFESGISPVGNPNWRVLPKSE